MGFEGVPERWQTGCEVAGDGKGCEYGAMRFRVASSFRERLVGLLGTDGSQSGADEMLCLVPCKSIHTFGMRYPIDVIFVDASGKVLLSEKDLAPKQMRRCSRACWVGERRSGSQAEWPGKGDVVSLAFGQCDNAEGARP